MYKKTVYAAIFFCFVLSATSTLWCMQVKIAVPENSVFELTKADENAVMQLRGALTVITHPDSSERSANAFPAVRASSGSAQLKEKLAASVHESIEQIKYFKRRFNQDLDNKLIRAASPRLLQGLRETLDACIVQLNDVTTVIKENDCNERVQLYARNALCGVEESLQELFSICAQDDAPASLRALQHEQMKRRHGVTVYPTPQHFVTHDSCMLLLADLMERYYARQKKEVELCRECQRCPEADWCESCCKAKEAADKTNPPAWAAYVLQVLNMLQPDDQLHYLDLRMGAQSASLDTQLRQRFNEITNAECTDTESQLEQQVDQDDDEKQKSVPEQALTPVSPPPAGVHMLLEGKCSVQDQLKPLSEKMLALHQETTAQQGKREIEAVPETSLAVALCTHADTAIGIPTSLITAQTLIFKLLVKKDAHKKLLQGLPTELAQALNAILETSPGKVKFATASLQAEQEASGLTWLGAWLTNRVLIGQEKKKAIEEANQQLPEDASLKEVVAQVHEFIDINGLRPLVPTIRALLEQYGDTINNVLAHALVFTQQYDDECAQAGALLVQQSRERALGEPLSVYLRRLGKSWWPKPRIAPSLEGCSSEISHKPGAGRRPKKEKKERPLSTLSVGSRMGHADEPGGLELLKRALQEYARAEQDERSECDSVTHEQEGVLGNGLV